MFFAWLYLIPPSHPIFKLASIKPHANSLLLSFQKRSFSRIGVKIWNSISCEVRQMSKSNFKNNVDDILLQKLLKYDDYIDVSIILANFDSLV